MHSSISYISVLHASSRLSILLSLRLLSFDPLVSARFNKTLQFQGESNNSNAEQFRSFATATDQLTSPDSTGTSSPVSVHHNVALPRNVIDLTPANLAAALSEVELALEFMNSTPTGVSAPSSWNGRCV